MAITNDLGDIKECIFEMVTEKNMEQLGNNMETREFYLEVNNAVFWDVEPCRSCVNRRLGGTYRLHLQGRKSISEEQA
jgi:hypothetical protein